MDTGRYKKNKLWVGFEPIMSEKKGEVFPLNHSLFVIKLHLTLIITLRMYTGWIQADTKIRNCKCDLNPDCLEQESDVYPLDHSLFLIKIHLTLIITFRMDTVRYKRKKLWVGFEPGTSWTREWCISIRPLTLLNQNSSDVNYNL